MSHSKQDLGKAITIKCCITKRISYQLISSHWIFACINGYIQFSFLPFYVKNSMSDPNSSFNCEVTSINFVLRIFFFLGSDSPSAAHLCDSIFLVGFLIRLDWRNVGEGDLIKKFFDADTLSSPTASDIWELVSESVSEDTTTTGACPVMKLAFCWDKTGYSKGSSEGNRDEALGWGGDELASNAADSASYFALISSCFFALRRALISSASAAIFYTCHHPGHAVFIRKTSKFWLFK